MSDQVPFHCSFHFDALCTVGLWWCRCGMDLGWITDMVHRLLRVLCVCWFSACYHRRFIILVNYLGGVSSVLGRLIPRLPHYPACLTDFWSHHLMNFLSTPLRSFRWCRSGIIHYSDTFSIVVSEFVVTHSFHIPHSCSPLIRYTSFLILVLHLLISLLHSMVTIPIIQIPVTIPICWWLVPFDSWENNNGVIIMI